MSASDDKEAVYIETVYWHQRMVAGFTRVTTCWDFLAAGIWLVPALVQPIPDGHTLKVTETVYPSEPGSIRMTMPPCPDGEHVLEVDTLRCARCGQELTEFKQGGDT